MNIWLIQCVALFLSVKYEYARKLVATGEIPSKRMGKTGHRRVFGHSILAFINSDSDAEDSS